MSIPEMLESVAQRWSFSEEDQVFVVRDGEEEIGEFALTETHGCVELSLLIIPEFRGMGHGRNLLRDICGLADIHDVELFLTVETTGPLDDQEAQKWYERSGFRTDPFGDDWPIAMWRSPVPVTDPGLAGRSSPASGPEHLPLHEQLTYTDGFCETFAGALLGHYGPQLRAVELAVTDPRYAARMDYPDDSRIAVHVFCLDGAGCAIDAEGRRTVEELMTGFGIGPSYRHEIIPKTPDAEHQSEGWDALLHARELIHAHGWPDQPERIPAADGRLARNFARARREQETVLAEREATAGSAPEI